MTRYHSYEFLCKDLLLYILIQNLLCSSGIVCGGRKQTGLKGNPLTFGKRKVTYTYASSAVCQAIYSGVFLPSFSLHSNPENKVVFSLFCRAGPLRFVGCSSSGNKRAVELRWEMRLSLPENLLVFARTWIRVEEGWRVSCPVAPIYINALEIVPVSHYHGRLLSVTSLGGLPPVPL